MYDDCQGGFSSMPVLPWLSRILVVVWSISSFSHSPNSIIKMVGIAVIGIHFTETKGESPPQKKSISFGQTVSKWKRYKSYYRSARLQVFNKFEQFVLYSSQSFLVFLNLFWSISTYLGSSWSILSWFSSVYLGLFWFIVVYIGLFLLSRAISDNLS